VIFAASSDAASSALANAGHQLSSAQYSLDLGEITDTGLRSKFVQGSADTETLAFLSACSSSNRIATGLAHFAALALLRCGFTRTSANGFTFRANMFVASEELLCELLPEGFVAGLGAVRTLLDIGAGDGGVTEVVARTLGVQPQNVVATEASWAMQLRLRSKGYQATNDLDSGGLPMWYDVVLF